MAKFTEKESNTLRHLDKLNKYCKKHFINESVLLEGLELKERFIVTYFIYGLSFSEGVHVLVRNNKPRAAIPSLRALYESWVNTRLLLVSDNSVWVYNLEAIAAKHTIKDGKHLLENNDYTKKPEAKKVIENAINDAEYRLKNAKSLFKELPIIEKVITPNNNQFDRDLKVFEKCKIIDYYDKPKLKKSSMVFNYETVYRHFSDVSHVGPNQMSDAFRRSGNKIEVDFNGKLGVNMTLMSIRSTYILQISMLEIFKKNISKISKTIPKDISNYANTAFPDELIVHD